MVVKESLTKKDSKGKVIVTEDREIKYLNDKDKPQFIIETQKDHLGHPLKVTEHEFVYQNDKGKPTE